LARKDGVAAGRENRGNSAGGKEICDGDRGVDIDGRRGVRISVASIEAADPGAKEREAGVSRRLETGRRQKIERHRSLSAASGGSHGFMSCGPH
jgi:hypothetical protein